MCILSQKKKKINFSNFPVNLWVASFMVYALNQTISSIWCIYTNDKTFPKKFQVLKCT